MATTIELNLLRECAKALLDAADMMNDGPDESDVAYAEGKITLAIKKAKAARVAADTEISQRELVDRMKGGEHFELVDDYVGLPFYPTDDGE